MLQTPFVRRFALVLIVALGAWFARTQGLSGPVAPTLEVIEASPPRERADQGHAARAQAAAQAFPTMAYASREVMSLRPKTNPFGTPDAVTTVAVKPVTSVAPRVAAIMGPPASARENSDAGATLPYRYIGMLVEPGRPTSVFLAVDDSLLLARPGEPLQGGYRLESIAPDALVFSGPRQGQTIRLPIEGDPL